MYEIISFIIDNLFEIFFWIIVFLFLVIMITQKNFVGKEFLLKKRTKMLKDARRFLRMMKLNKMNKKTRLTLSIIKIVAQCSFLGATIGFIVGDLIGVVVWLVTSIKTGHWGLISPFSFHYGIIFALIGLFVSPIVVFFIIFIKKKKRL